MTRLRLTHFLILILAAAPVRAGVDDPERPQRRPAPARSASSEKKWDVGNPPGPRRQVRVALDEGTWMSLDVRAQGDEIAFDLLGDIYVMPMTGGTARAVRTGLAWEMQPRYSPDGEWIAFTSDAEGGDNLWIMRRDGSEARAVSNEDFRLVNSPAWTPDGQYLAGRKHFTSERSLGAGEIWLWHRSGGKGVPMTEKVSDQKDLGEPAFSPDGRWLYFSLDATPGANFEYNKDPHAGIYAIRRLDREDGHSEDFIAGPGGAARPTPSFDGRQVAFVRRVGVKTAIFLRDVASGAERMLYDGLDRDLQETWAIHGVYPAMSFSRDDRHLVFWAGGKIRKVEVATGLGEVIPFRVEDERTVIDAVRFPIEVAPDRFHTRMPRWSVVAPDGASVVFQALGRLWLRPLPEGAPRRLTQDEGVSEMWPTFSPDGKWVVYTTWSDHDLGSIRVVSAQGGPARAISSEPGHYVEPAVSPDGSVVVYRRVVSDGLRSKRWTQAPGLYSVPFAGGAPTLVSRDGEEPHFAALPRRVYFSAEEQEGSGSKRESKRVLRSVGLDRGDPRVHARSPMATTFRVSPDGRWLAFQEQFNAYVTPMPATGRAIDVGPKVDALPVGKASRDAGNWLHWSGDSQRLHWSLGPELYSRGLADLFAFLAASNEKKDETNEKKKETTAAPPEHGIDIGFDVPADIPAGELALVGGRIVTMRGDEVIEDGTVLVARNRIVAVGPRAQVPVPAEARVIDVAGMTVIPGLVDVHYHGPVGSDGILPDENWSHYAALGFGVTTVHDPSSDTAGFFAASELVRAGLAVGPRLYSTGTVLYGAKSPFKAVIETLDDARSHLRRLQAVGAFSVKSYNQPRRDQRQKVLSAARELGMMVVPEGGSLLQANLSMVVDGHTGIEHAVPVARLYDDVVKLWAGTAVGYTPTLVVAYGGLFGENYWYQHTKVWEHPRLRRFVPADVVVPRARRRMMAEDDDWNHIRVATDVKRLAGAGVRVNVGAHGQREGLAAHWEMWMLAQGGMTPLEALRAGTWNGAAYLGLDRDIGSIAPGKLADLAIIDGNLLADIRLSENVHYTMKNGRLYDADTMDEIGNHPRRRAPFFWEEEGR